MCPIFFTALVTWSHAPRIAEVFVIVFTYLETKEVVNDVIYKHEKRKVCVSGGVIFYKSFLLNWPVTLRKEYSVFARSILRGISGFNRQEVRGSAGKCTLKLKGVPVFNPQHVRVSIG
jgi:hypothetical protein